MHWTVTNRVQKGSWNVPALSLVVALVGGVCVPGLAQSNTQKDTSFVSLNSSMPVANTGSPSRSASASSANQSSAGKYATGLSSLPPDAQAPILAALGKDDSGYWVHRSAKGFRGENPRQALVAEFTPEGAEVRSHNLGWGLETRGYGYGDAVHRVKAVAPQANANRVEYRRDGMTEWYENGPLGLEQGFTLAHRPGKANGEALTVELGLSGDVAAALEPGGKALELRRNNGEAVLRYTGLKAQDATGRELRSWLEVRGERLLVRVEDGGARYPVVVDPWVQQAELTASDGAAGDWFGSSVAVSGSTVVVGAIGHTVGSNFQQGAAYAFVESGGTWSQHAELTASDGAAHDDFGISVAVSGSTAVVGAPWHMVGSNTGQGAAYVFVESGGTWSQQAELTAPDGEAYDEFGTSVAISGSTALVGAPGLVGEGPPSNGKVYVFVQSGGTWSQQAELTASDGAASDLFGISVAVGGSTAVVGAPDHFVGSNYRQGAAYVFVESGGMWSQQAELTSSDGAAEDYFGNSVAVSGGTAVVGAAYRDAAYVFVQSGGTWSQQAKLTASDGYGYFGDSVTVSGSTAVVGARLHSNQPGAAYVFVQSGTRWSQQAKLKASDGTGATYFGASVALDDNMAVAGAPNHNFGSIHNQGAAYVFVPTTVSLSPASLGFGYEVIDTTSAAETVTVRNTSAATLDISSITASADFVVSSTTCNATLVGGKTCKVSVTFTPGKLGSVRGTLSFTDSAPNSPQRMWLSGTGVAAATLTPASVAYAAKKVGMTSAAKTFTLTNNQTVELTSIAISTTGGFVVSATTCATSLAAKSKCTINVTFTPTATGTRTGKLNVSDSASNSPQTSNLTGTGK